jgi:hypothetical protein
LRKSDGSAPLVWSDLAGGANGCGKPPGPCKACHQGNPKLRTLPNPPGLEKENSGASRQSREVPWYGC